VVKVPRQRGLTLRDDRVEDVLQLTGCDLHFLRDMGRFSPPNISGVTITPPGVSVISRYTPLQNCHGTKIVFVTSK